MDGFDELRDRVEAITKLNKRACQIIATSLLQEAFLQENEGAVYSAGQIVKEAERLGYEFERPEGVKVEDEQTQAFAAEVTMDPALVLSEVYESMPRVLCAEMPRIGQAPDELRQLDPELVDQIPEELRLCLVKIDMFEGKATFWLRDEANDVDRPIGPIDLTRYGSGQQVIEAIETLLRRDANGVLRLDRVLSADFN
jgi:hypothetical protein